MESWFSAMTFELSDRFETHADAKAKPAGQSAERARQAQSEVVAGAWEGTARARMILR